MNIRKQPWPWFAILVRTSTEKTVMLHLENAGYESFFPVCSCMRRSTDDEVRRIELPLFPGYLFCRMDPSYRWPVLRTPGVIQIVGVGEDLIPAEEEEIAALQRVGKAGVPTMPWPYMQVGELTRLDNGPLCGLAGVLIRIKSGLKLVLSVSLLQRSAAVEVDRSWLSATRLARPAAFRVEHDRVTSAS